MVYKIPCFLRKGLIRAKIIRINQKTKYLYKKMFFIKRTHQKYIQFDNRTSKNANKLAHHHKKGTPNIKVIHKHVSQKRYVCK